MKIRTIVSYILTLGMLLAFLMVAVASVPSTVLNAQYAAPMQVQHFSKQAPSQAKIFVWQTSDMREWLRIEGKSDAPTASDQWAPSVVTIESTKEPVVTRQGERWIIRFK